MIWKSRWLWSEQSRTWQLCLPFTRFWPDNPDRAKQWTLSKPNITCTYNTKAQVICQISIFEIVMLLCFGAAWPFSIHKSIVSHSINGKSLAFLLIVWIGYIAGILHKIFYNPDIEIFFYIINLSMVTVDIILYLRNRQRFQNNKTEN